MANEKFEKLKEKGNEQKREKRKKDFPHLLFTPVKFQVIFDLFLIVWQSLKV